MGELPLEDDELSRQTAVPADRSMAPAAATSTETSVRTQTDMVSARSRATDCRSRNGDGVPGLL